MKALALLAPLALTACVTTQIRSLAINSPPHAPTPRPVTEVEVFTDSRPTRDFVDVESYSVDVKGLDSNADALAKLRAQAAAAGCDGLIVDSPNGFVNGHYVANCIVYR